MNIRKRIKKHAAFLRDSRAKSAQYEAALQSEIRALVEPHGSAVAFSREIGICKSYMSDIQSGKRGIGDETILRLLEIED